MCCLGNREDGGRFARPGDCIHNYVLAVHDVINDGDLIIIHGCNNYVTTIYTGMDYNDKEINDVFKKLGLDEKEIKQAQIAHKIAEKIDDKIETVADALKQTGGGNSDRLKVLEEAMQKTFGFDRETMQAIDKEIKKEIKGGGRPVKTLEVLQKTFDFDAETMQEIEKQLMKKKGGDASDYEAKAANAKKFVEGNLQTIQNMLEAGIVDINVQDRRGGGDTALIWHARNGNAKIVEYLLKQKARVNIRNEALQTAMDVAILKKQKKCIQLLSNRFDVGDKIDVDIHDNGRWLPGQITEVHGDGTFGVRYKNGKEDKDVKGKDIRISAEELSGQSNFAAIGSIAVGTILYKSAFMATLPTVGGLVIGVGITYFSNTLLNMLDNLIDKNIMDETWLSPLCKALTYVCPTALLGYLVNWISGDYMGWLGTAAATVTTVIEPVVNSGVSPDVVTSSTHIVAPTLSTLMGTMKWLFSMASSMTGGPLIPAAGIILTTAMVGWIVKTYIWTRFRGSEEDNEKLTEAIYSNHRERAMIVKQHLKKMEKQEKSKIRQIEEYEKKLQEQIKLEDKISEKGETKKSGDKPGYKWYKFVPGQFPDVDERYLRGRTSTRRSKSKTKSSSSSRRRRASSKIKET